MVEGSHAKEEPSIEKIAKNNQKEQLTEVEDKVVATPKMLGDLKEISIEKSLEIGMS